MVPRTDLRMERKISPTMEEILMYASGHVSLIFVLKAHSSLEQSRAEAHGARSGDGPTIRSDRSAPNMTICRPATVCVDSHTITAVSRLAMHAACNESL